jgi:dethiobiotin synthetase
VSAGLILLGTDTGVGKTYIGCALASALRARGWRVGALKPVECGYDEAHSDGRLLAEACGETFAPDRHVPERFALPLSPLAAGREEGRAFDVDGALRHAHACAAACDLLIVETAGGIRVPLTEEVSNLELARSLRWPALLVARAALGTINHSVLSLEAAAAGGIEILGFVLNGATDVSRAAGGGNRRIIEDMSGIPCVGEVSMHADATEFLDWNRILPAIGRKERAE